MKVIYKYKSKQPSLLSLLLVIEKYRAKFIYKNNAILLISRPRIINKIRLDQRWNSLIKTSQPDKIKIYQ